MSIKKKLYITLLMVIAIMAGLSIFSVAKLKEVNNQSTVIAYEIVPKLDTVHNLNFYIARFRSVEYQHILLSTDAEMTTSEDAIDDVTQAMNQGAIGTQDVAKRITEIAQIAVDVDQQTRESAENARLLMKTVEKFIV